MTWHPSFETLARFAASDLSRLRRRVVTRHLESCSRCRMEITTLRKTRAAVRQSHADCSPPEELLQSILARRAAGERVILPVAEASPPRSFGRAARAAGIAALLVLCGVPLFILSTRVLDAERVWGELMLSPTQPLRGSQLKIEYRPAGQFADERQLILRARYRTPDDPPYNRGILQEPSAILQRVRRGLYRGAITLPDSVVFARFSVSDTTGRLVDHNARRLWEVMVHEAGKPLHAALIQKQNDNMGRDWEVAFEAARIATELYPGDPVAWDRLTQMEASISRGVNADSLDELHRQRFRIQHEELFGVDKLTGDELGAIFWLARTVRIPSDTAEYWRRRLINEAPRHALAVQERVVDILRSAGDEPADALAALEALWSDVGSAHFSLTDAGFNAALLAKDESAAVRWANRRVSLEPYTAPYVAIRLAHTPVTRTTGLSWLREQLEQMTTRAPDKGRRLDESIDEYSRRIATESSRLYAALGQVLVESGEIAAGLDALEAALTSAGWDVDLFRSLGNTRLAMGDAVGAVEILARIAVDPSTPIVTRDSIRALALESLESEEWEAQLQATRDLMYRETMKRAVSRKLKGRVRLLNFQGDPVAVHDVVGGGPALIAFWSRYCGPSLNELDDLHAMYDELRRRGVALVTITAERPTAELGAYLSDRGLDFPVYHDVSGRAHSAFNSWGTPDYFVLDSEGLVRFEPRRLDDVLRQLETLQTHGSNGTSN